jgi:hypothetical protein
MSYQPIPKFASEEEEAAWWDAHPEVLAERFQTARDQGQLRRLSQTNLPGASETVTIRIPQQELTRARTLAAKLGSAIRPISRCFCMKPWTQKKRSSPANRRQF